MGKYFTVWIEALLISLFIGHGLGKHLPVGSIYATPYYLIGQKLGPLVVI